ncbi:MAG: hypothetical protein VB100_06410 [Angelakisella sp.]|nr:hypothetical protein [Angelakisella sp.]
MNDRSREELIRQVTAQVLAALGEQAAPSVPGQPLLLVVGDPAAVPAEISRGATLAPIEDYAKDGNISRYEKVCITALSMTELCDIAQGRDSRPPQCAVLKALLCGKEVLMTQEAPAHRIYAGKGSSSLYQMLEGHVRTLQTFGIKIIGKEKPVFTPSEPKPARYEAPKVAVPTGSGKPNPQRLITETMAAQMVKSGASVTIARDAILTPSARDIFARAKVQLLREE